MFLSPTGGGVVGKPIGSMTIPPIPAGEERILDFPWTVPNPNVYAGISPEMDASRWQFSLLARIEAPDSDPVTFPETSDLYSNVRLNNNIAWKNVSVVEIMPYEALVMAAGNTYEGEHPFNIRFRVAPESAGLSTEAEISVQLDDVLYSAWQKGGAMGKNIVEKGNKTVLITGEEASLQNLIFTPKETGLLNMQFNFLTKEMTQQKEYGYYVIQTDAVTDSIIGGKTCRIVKSDRTAFYADAGTDTVVDKHETILLSAEQIGEPAVYNWYDKSGNLLYEGADFSTFVSIGQIYKLEVIALADGYKDYAEVEIKLKPDKIRKVSPNPASSSLNIDYKINDADNAYISVTGVYSGISNNYMLDVNANSFTLNLQNYPAGAYVITLVCNGAISDSKTFIKQ